MNIDVFPLQICRFDTLLVNILSKDSIHHQNASA